MQVRQVKLPGPHHPISIGCNPARVVISVAGRVVADTHNTLTLRETDRVFYETERSLMASKKLGTLRCLVVKGGQNERQSHSIRAGRRARGWIRSTGVGTEHKLEIELRSFHRTSLSHFHCRPDRNI